MLGLIIIIKLINYKFVLDMLHRGFPILIKNVWTAINIL